MAKLLQSLFPLRKPVTRILGYHFQSSFSSSSMFFSASFEMAEAEAEVVDQDVTVEGAADRFSSRAHLVAVVVVASVEVAASPVEVDPAAEAELAAVGNP